ncbi:Organic hydroperoxide resistance transcriptional regulator [Actinokineospora spheciospongiae]|uniref:Organic hydroperoxide resistance transcriptional regulator n=1 Tax=Actinokineospora spheciospongiae TaxID=909613 RepID=W7J687_9PSEU|nr:MarR family transcriptional regulator [Actinokineospora spheciospongiae]EWC61569.1 Organic hydroperoxide resistance transcriptional regulator [Actinokineospora spheciospongiae]
MTERDAVRLEQQLCFALYSASRAMTTCYRPLLEDLGLTYPQYLVMLALLEREPVTVKDLGATLRLDSGTLSPLLKRMAAAGLLTRSRSAVDERSVVVSLTEAGEALRGRIAEVPAGVLAALGSSLEQIVALQADVTAFLARMERAVGE